MSYLLEPAILNLDNLEFIDSHQHLQCQLIYLDPPYNSDRDYGSKEIGYTDSWEWDEASDSAVQRLTGTHMQPWGEFISTTLRKQDSGTAAYIAHLTPRFLGLHAMLSHTGTLVLQCDQSAVHWVRCTLDQVFGAERFHSMVNWKRTGSHNKDAKRCPPDSDYLLWYTKSDAYTWNDVRVPHTKQYLEGCRSDGRGLYHMQPMTGPGGRKGESGEPWKGFAPYHAGNLARHWTINREVANQYQDRTGKELVGTLHERMDLAYEAGVIVIEGKTPQYKGYINPQEGMRLQQTWLDIAPPAGQESCGFETQKPVALLERIIKLTTSYGDLVMDPYSGSGTTGVGAANLYRGFVGCELNPQTAELARSRIQQALQGDVRRKSAQRADTSELFG